jgi:hypothetical protein
VLQISLVGAQSIASGSTRFCSPAADPPIVNGMTALGILTINWYEKGEKGKEVEGDGNEDGEEFWKERFYSSDVMRDCFCFN